MSYRKYTSTDIHWRLIEKTEARDKMDEAVSRGGWVASQALFCPYYAILEGTLGSDWGVIVNPESEKFGEVVFEHHWCGCPVDDEFYTVHGGGQQEIDEWAVPRCRSTHTFRSTGWASCNREVGHKGKHEDRTRTWR